MCSGGVCNPPTESETVGSIENFKTQIRVEMYIHFFSFPLAKIDLLTIFAITWGGTGL